MGTIRRLDIAGKRWGRLVAVKRIAFHSGTHAGWLFRCDCGNLHEALLDNVRSGRSQSCGCLNREAAARRKLLDLKGQKFGKLTALRSTRRNGVVAWECVCECGQSSTVYTNNLRKGHTKSCGCVNVGANHFRYKHGMTGTKEYNNIRTRRRLQKN